MDKEVVVHIHNGVLLSHKKEHIWLSSNKVANLENSAVDTGLEKVSFHSNPKERQCQRIRLCDPMDCSLLRSSVHGIFQARVLEWTASAFFTSVWDECNCAVVWAFFGIVFLWDWNENWPFPVLCPLLSFQICWHIECNTLNRTR